ncbi:MAG: substrate-binding domain-containing protein [Rhodospirillaceae bacterium]
MIRFLSVLIFFCLLVPLVRAEVIPPELLHDLETGKIERPKIIISGSDTMSPFNAEISRHLAAQWQIPHPEERLAGTHAGFVSFCSGIGAEYPDVVAATRRMRQTEFDVCAANGIVDLIEVPLGYSAVVFVAKRGDKTLKLTPKIIFQALAAEVPQGLTSFAQDLLVNPYETWQQIDKKLPADLINVVLPGHATGTHSIFDDVFMQGGCRTFTIIKLIFYEKERVALCTTLRGDGRVVEIAKDYEEQVPAMVIKGPPGTVGVIPYFYAVKNADSLQILPVNGIMPTPQSIESDAYEGVHTVYYYFKRAHMRNHDGVGVVRGLRQFIVESSSEAARAPGGYLEALGLTPLPADMRLAQRRAALRLERFSR